MSESQYTCVVRVECVVDTTTEGLWVVHAILTEASFRPTNKRVMCFSINKWIVARIRVWVTELSFTHGSNVCAEVRLVPRFPDSVGLRDD